MMTSLSDLYDADQRAKWPGLRALCAVFNVPHPLTDVQYADGKLACTHAKRHDEGRCPKPHYPYPGAT